MTITTLQWADAQHAALLVTLDDGRVMTCAWPNGTWAAAVISAAILSGMAIAAEPSPPAPTQYQIDAAAARQYAKLQALMGMTPAQVQAWVAANVTNLAQAQDAITTLAVAVSVLARQL